MVLTLRKEVVGVVIVSNAIVVVSNIMLHRNVNTDSSPRVSGKFHQDGGTMEILNPEGNNLMRRKSPKTHPWNLQV
jgi:hypothetical protein